MLVEDKLCSGCEACASSCPTQAIQMKENQEGFYVPVIDEEKCVHCGLCERVCPIMHEKTAQNEESSVWAAQIYDEKICKESSSGGIGYAICRQIISAGGIVYGAAFSTDYSVHHIRCTNLEEIKNIMGSKYVQSRMDNIYCKIEKDLKEGKPICFIGTPCQNKALQNYVKSKNLSDERLFLVDFICHGVPSPMIWQEYLKEMRIRYNAEIEKIKFRNKKYSWKAPDLFIEWSDKTSISNFLGENIYYNLFFRNYILRESCYQCKFTSQFRVSDITLGDFWGAEETMEGQIDIDKGVSFIMVNSKKGQKLWGEMEEQCWMKRAEFSMCYQRNLHEPTPRPQKREEFWRDYHTTDDKSVVLYKYGKANKILYRAKRVLTELLKKLKLYHMCVKIVSKVK